MTGRPVIHVGIPRGASTFLQKRIFPNVPGYRYVREPNFEALGHGHLDVLDAELRDAFRSFADQNVILSQESSLFRFAIYTGRFHPDPRIIFSNIHELYGRNCMIVMVIRRQDTAIDSMIRFKQRYLSNPSMYLMDYPVRTSIFGVHKASGLYGKLLDAYNYHSNVFLLLPAFGKENIRILLYEDLINDPAKFFRGLSECFGADLTPLISSAQERENVRHHKYENLPKGYVPMGHILRKLNNLSGYRLEKLLPERKFGLPPDDAKGIMKIFADQNRLLDDLFGLGLQRYGYY